MQQLLSHNCDPPVDLVNYTMPRPMLEATADQYSVDIVALSRDRICVRCGSFYTMRDSMGRLQCSRHPGNVDKHRQLWQCCGDALLHPGARSSGGRGYHGCTPSDHHDSSAAAAKIGNQYVSATLMPLPVYLTLPERGHRHVLGVVPRSAVREYRSGHYEQARLSMRDAGFDDYTIATTLGAEHGDHQADGDGYGIAASEVHAQIKANTEAIVTRGTDSAGMKHGNFSFVPPALLSVSGTSGASNAWASSLKSSPFEVDYDQPPLDMYCVVLAGIHTAPELALAHRSHVDSAVRTPLAHEQSSDRTSIQSPVSHDVWHSPQ